MSLNHKHIVIKASGLKFPPTDPNDIKDWLVRLVKSVNMKVLMGPYASYCEEPDNEGVTGIIVLTTSHASVHVWSKVDKPFLQMDLYSCANFASPTVIKMLDEFGPENVEYLIIDRNDHLKISLWSLVLQKFRNFFNYLIFNAK